jgi:hypothetical protein
LGAQPNKAIASHPSRAACSAQLSDGLRKFVQSSTNCRQRCRGTSVGGRSGFRQAIPSIQSLGIRCSGAGFRSALADRSLSRGNSHSQWLRDPKPARSDLMRRDFFACLNALVWVMRCRSLSNPAARALASSLVTAWAPSASAARRNFTTSDSAARPFIRRIWPSGGRTERRDVANGALCPHAVRPRYSHVRDPPRGVLMRPR